MVSTDSCCILLSRKRKLVVMPRACAADGPAACMTCPPAKRLTAHGIRSLLKGTEQGSESRQCNHQDLSCDLHIFDGI